MLALIKDICQKYNIKARSSVLLTIVMDSVKMKYMIFYFLYAIIVITNAMGKYHKD